jgi:hypothetical protein
MDTKTPFAGHHFLEQEITFLMFEVSEEAGEGGKLGNTREDAQSIG